MGPCVWPQEALCRLHCLLRQRLCCSHMERKRPRSLVVSVAVDVLGHNLAVQHHKLNIHIVDLGRQE